MTVEDLFFFTDHSRYLVYLAYFILSIACMPVENFLTNHTFEQGTFPTVGVPNARGVRYKETRSTVSSLCWKFKRLRAVITVL
ncbi:hypothetical protein T01_7359 [Trichinella spiralis]|uniref:Uncharacterized protein n=1 Tax=Trichinella spiralis TaxID=6334 RepID=A0A0V1ANC5_TRISP|nr:hypothetical protein T01_7359 [Trichinella spiralis]